MKRDNKKKKKRKETKVLMFTISWYLGTCFIHWNTEEKLGSL